MSRVLTAEQALDIYRRACAGEAHAAIAADHGIDRTHVSHIKSGRCWWQVTKLEPWRHDRQNIDWSELLPMAKEQGWCPKKVAQKAGCTPEAVRTACKRLGIRIARPYERNADFAARMLARAGA